MNKNIDLEGMYFGTPMVMKIVKQYILVDHGSLQKKLKALIIQQKMVLFRNEKRSEFT